MLPDFLDRLRAEWDLNSARSHTLPDFLHVLSYICQPQDVWPLPAETTCGPSMRFQGYAHETVSADLHPVWEMSN